MLPPGRKLEILAHVHLMPFLGPQHNIFHIDVWLYVAMQEKASPSSVKLEGLIDGAACQI